MTTLVHCILSALLSSDCAVFSVIILGDFFHIFTVVVVKIALYDGNDTVVHLSCLGCV